MAMRIPKEMESRYATILLAGIPAAEVRIKKITDDEIIAEYDDTEEVHMAQDKVCAWWPDPKRERAVKNYKEAARKRAKSKEVGGSLSQGKELEGTNTLDE